ncbi:hypothetical protein SUGI_0669590 [Cryptomeria japonica]|uniref:protein LONGIFOLIA 1 n=1 Tax=Cryptomeria japonica TaxID=3369 RepID=UPI002414A2CF|nr:protein LONGIFOLIA 1 [Cryptomeria japonica]GLJ33283.1 hypothetical protein SUGI_0669590 [Cryptomeria japonica]
MSASAKFLHGISDDPQLEKQMEKQIGCMAGFLQLFDRHQILTGKRLYGPKRLVAAGHTGSSNSKLDAAVASAQNVTSEDSRKHPLDSCGSSNAASRASSMDCNDSTCQSFLSKEQMLPENFSTARIALQSRAKENSSSLLPDNKDAKAAHVSNNSRAPILSRDQPRFSLDSSRHSLDIRDVVRDTFYRDSPKPFMDTRVQNKKEMNKYSAKNKSSMDGKVTATTGKEPISMSPKSLPKNREQLQASHELAAKSVMDANLKKASGNSEDSQGLKKFPRGSKESLQSSHDSREIARASFFECKDALSSSFKLREAPRLSLDSRAHLGGGFYGREITNDKQGIDVSGHNHGNLNSNVEEMNDGKKRSPSVVARLMGLEAFPGSNSTSQKRAELRRSASESRVTYDILRSQHNEGKIFSQFKTPKEAKNNHDHKSVENAASRQSFPSTKQKDSSAFVLSKTPKTPQSRSHYEEDKRKEAETIEKKLQFPEGSVCSSLQPHSKQKTADPRPVNTHRYPIEAAPWKQREGWQSYQQNAFGAWSFSPERKKNSSQGTYDLYNEIENRLKQRGLEGSGKDFETLKQIVEAVQLKSLQYSEKDRGLNHNQQSSFFHQGGLDEFNYTPRTRIFYEENSLLQQRETQDKIAKSFEAPIVVMKPAKLLSNLKSPRASQSLPNQREKVGNASSQIGYRGKGDRASSPSNNTKTREPVDNCGNDIASTVRQRRERITNEALQREPNSRRPQLYVSPPAAARSPQPSHALSSMKSPNSPTQNKQRSTKAENERMAKHSGSPTKQRDTSRSSSPLQSPKSARQTTGKKNGPDKENSFSRNKMKIKETFATELGENELNLSSNSPLVDEVSLLSESNRSTTSLMEMEKSDSTKTEDDGSCDAETNYIGSKDSYHCDKSLGSTEVPEQPSPVSVLDSSFYKEDCSPSPVMKRSITFSEERNDDSDLGISHCLSFITNQQCQLDDLKLDEPLDFTHKLHCNSAIGIQEAGMDTIRLKLESNSVNRSHGEKKPNPTYSYIAEILLASGLLEDTEAYPVVYHSSVSPIDPQLFSVLEQRHSFSETRNGQGQVYTQKKKMTYIEQSNRELTFSTVNDILCTKLSPYLNLRPWMCSAKKIQRKRPTGQELLKEVWDDFQGLPTIPSEDICETLLRMLQKDFARDVDSWDDHAAEIAGAVLDIERMIFKDLIDDTIREMGAVGSKCLASMPRKKLCFT